jgi:hypothetical protein
MYNRVDYAASHSDMGFSVDRADFAGAAGDAVG